MNKTIALISALLIILCAPVAFAEGTIEDLPFPPSFFPGFQTINFDGSVVGGDWGGLFVYTELGGVTMIDVSAYGDYTSAGGGHISGDGNTLSFNIKYPDNVKQAAYWTADGGLGLVPSTASFDTCSSSINSAYGVNFDGTVHVGLGYYEGCAFSGYKWTMGDEFSMGLPDNEGEGARANSVSGDGSVVGGWAYPVGSTSRTAALWTGDASDPQMIYDGQSEVYAVSNDGTKACGNVVGGALYYDTTVGAINLGALPGDENFGAIGLDISDDGKIVGQSGSQFFGTPRAFIWTLEDGMMYLGDYLVQQGVPGAEDISFFTAQGISADGNTIVGAYTNAVGMKQSFIVRLNGTVGIEDIEDPEVTEDDTPSAATKLVGAYPNPFNPMTSVKFSLDRDQHVSLYVYDVNGRQVAELASEVFAAGEHSVVWQGRDASGRSVASGNYLLRLVTSDGVQTSKMMLVR